MRGASLLNVDYSIGNVLTERFVCIKKLLCDIQTAFAHEPLGNTLLKRFLKRKIVSERFFETKNRFGNEIASDTLLKKQICFGNGFQCLNVLEMTLQSLKSFSCFCSHVNRC